MSHSSDSKSNSHLSKSLSGGVSDDLLSTDQSKSTASRSSTTGASNTGASGAGSKDNGSSGTRSAFIGSPGPFQIIDNDGKSEAPVSAPRRRYSCAHYDACLNLAAALNWDNFTCRGCCGSVDQSMLWRAHQAKRRDEIAGRLCDIPELSCVEDGPTVTNLSSHRKVVA